MARASTSSSPWYPGPLGIAVYRALVIRPRIWEREFADRSALANGERPAPKAYRVAPNAQTSLAMVPVVVIVTTSGADQGMDIARCWDSPSCLPRTWEIPKSDSTGRPRVVSSTLEGLMSRCSTRVRRSEEHTSELQSRGHLVCRLLLEKKDDRTLHQCEVPMGCVSQ